MVAWMDAGRDGKWEKNVHNRRLLLYGSGGAAAMALWAA